MSGKPNGKFMPRFVLPLVLAGGSLAIMLVMLAGHRNVVYAVSARPLPAAGGSHVALGLLPPPRPARSPVASPPVATLSQGGGGPSVITVCASCPYTTVQAAVSGNLWQTNAPVTVGPLAASAGADVEVTVTIVDTAQSGDFDAATVTATSQEDPSVSDSSMLITMVSAACEPVSGHLHLGRRRRIGGDHRPVRHSRLRRRVLLHRGYDGDQCLRRGHRSCQDGNGGPG